MVSTLASYFFGEDQPIVLTDLEFRKPGTRAYESKPTLTAPNVPGLKYLDKEVYILTSHGTPSAAEEFTYDLQALKRATIVGEVTWGGANPGGVMPIGAHFAVFMPSGHSVNPITKTNWEGVGVKPDIETPADDALKVARKTALEHLIAKAGDQNGRQLGDWKRALADLQGQSAELKKP
jgi:C-terminal processing protease CtpA/Prc